MIAGVHCRVPARANGSALRGVADPGVARCPRAGGVPASSVSCWFCSQRKGDPLAESQRKRRQRSGLKHRMSREFAGLRREVARLQMVLLGMLMLLGSTSGEDLVPVVSRCVDRGRDVLPEVARAVLEEEQSRVRDIAPADR